MADGDPASTRRGVVALFHLVERLRGHYADVAERHGLTALHATALSQLAEPLPMKALAGVLQCDASNATTLVDRLERAGLVDRRPHPDDGRVRVVERTTTGSAAFERFDRDLYDTAPFGDVPVDDLVAVRLLIDRILAGDYPSGQARR